MWGRARTTARAWDISPAESTFVDFGWGRVQTSERGTVGMGRRQGSDASYQLLGGGGGGDAKTNLAIKESGQPKALLLL